MIFLLTIPVSGRAAKSRDKSPDPVGPFEFHLDAPSHYDAREWARSRYHDFALTLAPPGPGDCTAIVIGRAAKTSQEPHDEYRDAIYQQGYEAGVKDTIAQAHSIVTASQPNVQKPKEAIQ